MLPVNKWFNLLLLGWLVCYSAFAREVVYCIEKDGTSHIESRSGDSCASKDLSVLPVACAESECGEHCEDVSLLQPCHLVSSVVAKGKVARVSDSIPCAFGIPAQVCIASKPTRTLSSQFNPLAGVSHLRSVILII